MAKIELTNPNTPPSSSTTYKQLSMHLNVAKVKMLCMLKIFLVLTERKQSIWRRRSALDANSKSREPGTCGRNADRSCRVGVYSARRQSVSFITHKQHSIFFSLVCLNQEGPNLCFSGGVLSIKWGYLPLFGLSLDPGLLATYVSISGPLFLVFMALIPQKGSVFVFLKYV